MKKAKLLMLLWAIPTFVFTQTASEYGVEVIRSPKVYKQQIRENPSLKLVDLGTVEGLHFDIRYATENNFTGEKVYELPMAFARTSVAMALDRVNKKFNKHGLAIKIFDAYRPYSATVKFYELVKDTTYVASPYSGSRHNRGCAVDLTLIDLETGEEIDMPTEFDNFTEKAHPDYQDLPEHVKNNRDFLIKTMTEYGFTVYEFEWWHFDFHGWEEFPLMDLSFEQLQKTND